MKKMNKLSIIFLLGLFVFIINIGTTFAFWASSIAGDADQSSAILAIGEWDQFPTEYIGVTQTGEGLYITLDQIGTIDYPLTGKYMQMGDIDFGNAVFAPIGGAAGVFSGEFLGNGFSISNVSITAVQGFVGLFARNSGLISGVSLININLNVTSTVDVQAGLIAGENTGSIIYSYVTGSVTVTSSATSSLSIAYAYAYGGGIAGTNSGNIHNSYSDASVTVTSNMNIGSGGNRNGYALSYAGGLVGRNTSVNGIFNTYATGAVNAIARVTAGGNAKGYATVYSGGLVGENTVANGVNNSFATGNVTYSHTAKTTVTRHVGGLIGLGASTASFRLSTQTVTGATNLTGTTATQTDLRLQTWVVANLLWSTNDWTFNVNNYPRLTNNKY